MYCMLKFVVVVPSPVHPAMAASLICNRPSWRSVRSNRGCARCGPCRLSWSRRWRWPRQTSRSAGSGGPRRRQSVWRRSPCFVCRTRTRKRGRSRRRTRSCSGSWQVVSWKACWLLVDVVVVVVVVLGVGTFSIPLVKLYVGVGLVSKSKVGWEVRPV